MQSKDEPPDMPGNSLDEGYEVGYGKPPKHTRFRPGRSGNPAGRRKGVRNLMTDVKRTLQVPVKVKESGRARKISTQEGALMLLREKALQGDARALDRLLELASRFNNDGGESGPAPALAPDDRAILDAYTAEIAASQTIASLDGQASSPRPDFGEDPSGEDPSA
jgi:Family of unknown function (DUF5681)